MNLIDHLIAIAIVVSMFTYGYMILWAILYFSGV
jgi:hypothetical protein